MTELSIFNWWYKCPNCKKEISHSSSSPLEYGYQTTCPNCATKIEVVLLVGEPEVMVTSKGVGKE